MGGGWTEANKLKQICQKHIFLMSKGCFFIQVKKVIQECPTIPEESDIPHI